MKQLFLILLVMLAPSALKAQQQTGDLSFKSGNWSYNYYIGNQQIPYDSFMEKLNGNEAAARMFKSGRSLDISGSVIGCVGAFCFGYDLGTRIGGGKGNTTMLVGGGGVMACGMIMSLVGQGKMKKALRLYKGKDNAVSMALNINPSGAGISFNF
jgi:hypothetical protein